MKIADSHEWLMWQAQHGGAAKLYRPPLRRAVILDTAKEPVTTGYVQAEPLRLTPKPPRSQAEYHAERRKKRRCPTLAAVQIRLVAALMRHEDVGAVEHELGYTMQELRRHLERQFMDGMSWDNHASLLPRNQLRNAWAIDHIVPKSAFGDHECRAAFRLSNLRPLWWKENMRKAALRTHLL